MGLLSNAVNEGELARLGPLFTWKFALMVSFILGSIFIFRFFCRFLCPLGALYGFFCKIAMIGLKVDKNKCTDCGLCIKVCKMDTKKVGDHECIQCGECISVCPTKAIAWKGSKVVVRGNDTDVDPSNGLKPLTALLKKDVEKVENIENVPTAPVENAENENSQTGVDHE
jgi:ferredoxin